VLQGNPNCIAEEGYKNVRLYTPFELMEYGADAQLALNCPEGCFRFRELNILGPQLLPVLGLNIRPQ